MTNFATLYDACVLYPAPLRDLLMNLAITDLYRAKWTNEIHEVVTYNLKDFPKESISKYGIEAQHPDEFLMNLFDLSSEMVCLAVKRHRISLKSPPKNLEQYLSTLSKQSLKKTVLKLQEFSDYI